MFRNVEFRILGPLEVGSAEGLLKLDSRKQSALLACFVIHPNTVLSTDQLLDAVWGAEPPSSGVSSLRFHVSKLRDLLDPGRTGSSQTIVTRPSGYELVVEPEQIDARRFELIAAEGRVLARTQPSEAAALLKEALAMWRGRALAEFQYEEFAVGEANRLDELRLIVIGDRIGADLARGAHRQVVDELESLTREYPLREELRAHQMLALYRSGRQADALRVYARTRAELLELGLDPSRALQVLEEQILVQDKSLELTTVPEPTPSHRQVVRGYELRSRVRRVHRGYQTSTGREVAIKVLDPELANDPGFIYRFEPGARRLASLNHPNILPLVDYWRDPTGAYVVSDWVRGSSLEERLTAGPIDMTSSLQIINQVGAALAFAHRSSVTHGNLRPANVMIDTAANALLTDFAIPSASINRVELEDTIQRDIKSLLILVNRVAPNLPLEVLGNRHFDRVEDLVRAVTQAAGVDVTAVNGLDSPPLFAPRNPYKGLRAFQETDAGDFFGRDELVSKLIDALTRHRLVTVVGPSGSGKSSLVRAGLLPAVRAGAVAGSEKWLVTDMFPGNYPFEELEAALLRVAVDRPGSLISELESDDRGLLRAIKQMLPHDEGELLLVIDQFEELFSTAISEAGRQLFLANLTAVINDERSRARVVLTLRADFFHRPLEYEEFGLLVSSGLISVTPPGEGDLTDTIALPARNAGLILEPGLVGEVVRDVIGQPGMLPLMQYALSALADEAENGVLKIEAYQTAGGVGGSVGRKAEEIYTSLDSKGQEAARQLFLRLVSVGDMVDTRRRVAQSELNDLGVDKRSLNEAEQKFGAQRLLSFDTDPHTRAPTVEVAHEALIQEWPRLRDWIEERREDLILQRRFLSAVREWEDSGHDVGYLLSGSRLIQFGAWVDNTELSLTETERSYLALSRINEETRRRSARNRRIGLVSGFAAAVISVAAIGSLAFNERMRANEQSVVALQQTELAEDFEAAVARERATVEELEQQIEPSSGTLATPIGTFTWEHITGDDSNIPGSFVAMTTPSGFAMIDSEWDPSGSGWKPARYRTSEDGKNWTIAPFPIPLEAEHYQTQKLAGSYWVTTRSPASLWRSEDGQTWSAVPLPSEIATDNYLFLYEVDGTLWLGTTHSPFSAPSSTDVQGIWRSENGSVWEAIDTTSFRLPEIPGVASGVRWWDPVTVGDRTLIRLDGHLTINFYDILGVSEDEYPRLVAFWDPSTETMAVNNDGGGAALATFTLEVEGNRRVLKDETGEAVHEISIPNESLASLLEGWNFDGWFRLPTTLAVIDADGTATAVTPPWAITDSSDSFSYGFQGETTVLATEDQFLAYVTTQDGGITTGELWTSSDAITWSGPTKPDFLPDDGEADYFWIEKGGGLIRAHVSTANEQQMWISDDGLTWEPFVADSQTGVLLELESGYAFHSDTVNKEMFVSTDLRTWERVDTSTLGIRPYPNGAGWFGGYSTGETIFFVINEEELGYREMWVLKLEN
jgi:DNA-binding SARP family transcriptional activator